MALTATEQLRLMSGEVKPPLTDLLTLTHQTAFMFAKSFYDAYKEFPLDDGGTPALPINQLANNYLEKMLGVCSQIIGNNINTIERINRMVVVIIGSVAPDIGVVENATQLQWEDFVFDQMDEALEYVSGVRRNEKTEYITLP